MTRQVLTFPCEGQTLSATLDLPDGAPPNVGLFIVSGGTEIRSGAWSSNARIAAAVAAAGFAAFRFDRRGVGDSEGANEGFRSAAPDIAAALAAFRGAVPSITRIVAHGNCDGASALMLAHGRDTDALVLSNPWTFEEENAGPSVKALREHYKRRLMSLAAVERLLTGKVSIVKLIQSLVKMTRPAPPPSTLATQMAEGLAGYAGRVRLLVATNDYTAQAFLGAWDAKDNRLAQCAGATHCFVEPHAREWLMAQILDEMRRV